MEGQQHTNASRLTEWQQEQSLSQASPQEPTLTHHLVSQQSRKLKHIPMSKLSLNYIFIKKQHQKHLYKQHLQQKNKSAHNYFYQMRQNFQSDIYSFMKKYQSMSDGIDEQESVDQSVSEISSQYLIRQNASEEYSNKRMRKMTEESISSPSRSKESSKKVNEGGYFWNNWRSYESYPCIKAINENTFNTTQTNTSSYSNTLSLISPQNLSSHLVYAVIDMDFDRALKIIDSISQQWPYQEQGQSNKTSQNISSIIGSKHVKEVVVVSGGDNKRISQQGNNSKAVQTKSIINSNIKMQKQNSLNLKSLRIIIKGLKTLSSLIKFTDQLNNNSQLSQTFFYRNQFHLLEDHYLNDPKAKINLLHISIEEIESSGYFKQSLEMSFMEDPLQGGVRDKKKFDKKPSYNPRPQSPMRQRKTMKSTQNLMNFKNSPKKPRSIQQLKYFLQLRPKYQKICILNNLMFIINFAKKIRIQNCDNDYFRLLFCYLKNGHDQMIQGRCQIEWKQYSYSETRKNSDESNKLSPLLQQESSDNLSQASSTMFKQVTAVNYRQQIDYLSLLLSLQKILIFDRINFAARLLPKHKKLRFTQQLNSRIVKLPYIDNLLLFTKLYKEEMSKSPNEDMSYVDNIKSAREATLSSINRVRKNSIDGFQKWATSHQIHSEKQRSIIAKQKPHQLLHQQHHCAQTKDTIANKLKSICQNYIDQTGNLATVAYLAIQYECLEKESLLLSFEQDELEKLDAMKQALRGEQWTDKKTYLAKKYVPFLEQVNFRQEKLNDNPHQEITQMIDSRRCQICSLKIFPDKRQCYIQCTKCRHGGHFEHLIKWYNNYQNCPNVNCACVCN